MFDANRQFEVERIHNEGKLIEKTNRVYKPSYTIEFNREGEVLLYSCDPLKHVKILISFNIY